MIWNYTYTSQIWPALLTLFLLITLAFFAWRRRSVPGVVPFTIACLLAVPWVAGSILEFSAVDVATKIFWVKFQAIWQLPSTTAVTCFILEYTWPGHWLKRRNLVLLSIAPLLSVILVLTNNLHHLEWSGFVFDGSVLPLRGPGAWLMIAYAYGLSILNLIVLVWLFVRSPQHRWPAGILIIGQIGMHSIYILEKAYIVRFNLPLDVIGLGFLNLMYAAALFGFRILDPIPLAHQAAIRQLRDGMLVIDPLGRVISLNPAAERLLRMNARQIKGRLYKELLPACPEMPLDEPGGTEIEFSMGTGSEIRHYLLETSVLNDFRGLNIGRLLLVRDVTGRKQAQVQQTQRMWAQATLQEREQLASELHDGLSQNLAFLNLQAQAAQVYLQSGQGKSARASLERLIEAADQIQEDTREMIDQLLTVSQPADNFCAILRKMLAGFEVQTGLAVQLEVDKQLDGQKCSDPASLTPPAAVQLVRITQEALVNIRKHAQGANQVSVALSRRDGQLVLSIADDGQGFDPDGHHLDSKHFGLQVMRQRAARIGGQVEIDSAPGRGTRIEVSLPQTAPERLA